MNLNSNSLVTCKKCGWVHFEVSREYAELEVKRFNEYFNKLTPQQQLDYYDGKGASLNFYECCFFCNGSYKNFRDFKPGDCPDGCTLNSIVGRDE